MKFAPARHTLVLLKLMELGAQAAAAPTVPNTLGVGINGPVALSSLSSRSTLIYLGYSQCAETCPLALRSLERAFHALGSERRKCMNVVFVDVSEWGEMSDRSAAGRNQSLASQSQHAQRFLDSFFSGGVAVVPENQQERSALLRAFGAELKPIVDQDPLVATRYSHARSFYFVSNKGNIESVIPVSTGYDILLDAIQRETNDGECRKGISGVEGPQK